mmetsp:Transcript_45027/g.113422  ORF Transcript_45027/g.113422 Transcript_45027/m.113422 type:complete len:195 (+) Transcript_45027:105-689(+)|eukprot:CAMPEP_0177650876 /NCGR_PEP_ID=MMETSP0447-20121125/12203_1 /TAXON_ID=0 /ORGANISM="Stygamoeba regulata, Strain BSH-02190019" /LENGTH=194 /DNA_ID=CAMNT_0019153829 /DNA_START=112 /DNA_END=696 /DNA_ORIENTATION=-
MSFAADPLPYAKNALSAGGISEETVTFHYEKHHCGYVAKLNAAVKDKPEAGKSLEELVRTAEGGIFNNAAQIWNHNFYWKSLSPNGGGEPTGKIAEAITAAFGSFQAFKDQFTAAAATHFGSGWAWLVQTKDGALAITSTHDAGCPLRDGATPLLTCDVWEHAYYIDFRNDRAKYIETWWKLVNWEFASQNLSA